MDVHTVNDQTFEQDVLRSRQPVLLRFEAEWCGACQQSAGDYADLAEEYEGRVLFAALDADKDGKTPKLLSVQSVPTYILFSGGVPRSQIVGAIPKDLLREHLESIVGGVPC